MRKVRCTERRDDGALCYKVPVERVVAKNLIGWRCEEHRVSELAKRTGLVRVFELAEEAA